MIMAEIQEELLEALAGKKLTYAQALEVVPEAGREATARALWALRSAKKVKFRVVASGDGVTHTVEVV